MILSNTPTLGYIYIKEMLITYNNIVYQISNVYTNKAFIYWDVESPHELITSNKMLSDKKGRYYICWNDSGIYTLVPLDDVSISFSEDSNKESITEKVLGFREQNEENANRFTTIEADINGIRTSITETNNNLGNVSRELNSKIEQTTEDINFSISEVEREFGDNKVLLELRDNTNIALLDLQSELATFSGDMNSFMENNVISSEEKTKINAYINELKTKRTTLNTQIDDVIKYLTSKEMTTEATKLTSQKSTLSTSIDNLISNINTVCTDNTITNTEMTTVVTYFGKANTEMNITNNMIDDYIFLGTGGKMAEVISNLSISKNSIEMSVSNIEQNITQMTEKLEKSVANVDVMYYLSTKTDSLSGGSWTTTAPTWTNGKYMWTKTITTYTDGTTNETEPMCIAGATGQGISSVVNYYLASSSSSGVTTSTSGWTTTVQTPTSDKKYLWNYEKLTYTNGSASSTTPCIIGNFASDGVIGKDGKDGKGISSITEYFAVSNSNSTTPTSWSTNIQNTTTANKYLWNYEKITYTDGSTSETKKRVIGTHGQEGKGVSSVVNYYLASSSSSGVTTSTSGWSTTIQTPTSDKKYLWNYEKITYTDNSTSSTTPCIIGNFASNGSNGKGISSVAEYYLVSSASSGITTSSSGWSTTVPTMTTTNKYLWNYEKITYTDDSTTTVSPKVIGVYGNTGAMGQGVESITEEYYLSTSKTSQTDGSWSTTVPTWTKGKYMWTRSKIVYKNPTSTVYTTPICDSSWEAVNDIEIGGRNLIRQANVAVYNTTGSYNRETNTWTLTAEPGAGESWGAGLILNGKNILIPYGKTYVLSFEIKVPRACSWAIDVNNYALSGSSWNGNNNDYGSVRATSSKSLVANQWIKCWSRVSNTHSSNTNKEDIYDLSHFGVLMKNETSSMTFQIRNVQGELGNVPTEYTPAPEDVQTQIDSNTTQITTTKNKVATIETNVGSITSKVTNLETTTTTINGKVTGIDTRLKTAEQKITDEAITSVVSDKFATKESVSKIQQKADNIELSVSKKVDKGSIISAINMSPETIKINASKINISGFVTFSDLSTSGYTTINGSNITTGTIDASRVTVKNLNASNITTGTLSGDYIYGGILKGVLLQTYADSTSKGVSIGKDSLGLNSTYFSYYSTDEFRISSPQRISVGSANDIYLMAGLVSGSTQTNVNNVVVPNATLRTQRLNVVEGANFQSTVAISSTLSCNSISSIGTVTCNSLNSTSSVTCNSLSSVGSVTGNNVTINTGSIYLGTRNETVTSPFIKLGTAGFMSGYAGFHFVQSNGSPHNVYAGTFYSNGSVITSDRKKKKNIKYVDKDKQTSENGVVSPNVNITKNDMHEFIEVLPLVSFRYINEFEDGIDRTHYGVITQDILYTKVGSELVEVINENETTGISQDKFMMFLCGALQKEIQLRKELEEKVIELENKLK